MKILYFLTHLPPFQRMVMVQLGWHQVRSNIIISVRLCCGWHTICSLKHFPLWEHFVPPVHFAPWNTLPLNTVCSLAHSTPWNALLLSTLCFLEHSGPWNPLLPGTLSSFVKFSSSTTLLPWTLLKTKEFQEVKCFKEHQTTYAKIQRVLRSKVCWEVKWVECQK